ncbi:uncharacterized protein [Nicotiana tomentosiformis]|uniref:uncharacterized protein n=1 Tax=Nicotiana tomentosiformis TaxID=4098 RepID=UPI00388C4DAC
MRDFVPQTLRDAWRVEFKKLRHGTLSVSEYAIRFKYLSRHALALVSTFREWVRKFIEGLSYGISFSMARELETDVSFQQLVEIARRLEGMLGQEREDRMAKKPHGLGGSIGPYFGGRVCHGRGFVGQPVQFALQFSPSFSNIHGSQSTRTGQLPQLRQRRGCFECGYTIHIVRDCPRLRTYVSQRGIQAMSSTPNAVILAPPARGRG